MIVVSSGPEWPNVVTAIGTVAVAVAAVGIAIWADCRTSIRIKGERERSDKIIEAEHARAEQQLADERTLADRRLAEQLAHSDAQLAGERAAADARLRDELEHADTRLQEQRELAKQQEQLAEAWSVQVVGARIPPGENVISTADNPSERPMVLIVNRGRYTITRLEARFADGSGFTGSAQPQPFRDFANLPHELVHDVQGVIGDVYLGVLMPGGAIRIIGDAMQTGYLRTIYPVVRWTDRWGTWWEHKQGNVRPINEDQPWKP